MENTFVSPRVASKLKRYVAGDMTNPYSVYRIVKWLPSEDDPTHALVEQTKRGVRYQVNLDNPELSILVN